MPIRMVAATVSSFDGVFEIFRSEAAENNANLILFLADKDPSTDLSCCPGRLEDHEAHVLRKDREPLAREMNRGFEVV